MLQWPALAQVDGAFLLNSIRLVQVRAGEGEMYTMEIYLVYDGIREKSKNIQRAVVLII